MRKYWVVSNEGYQRARMDRPSAAQIRSYYGGFKKREPMYKDELKDLVEVYEETLESLQEEVEKCLPCLLVYMEEFLTLHKNNEAIREKLDCLKAKMGCVEEDGDDE